MTKRISPKFVIPLPLPQAAIASTISEDEEVTGATDSASAVRILLTYEDVARQWQVSSRTVQRYYDDGMLLAVKLGHGVRFRQSDIDAFIEQRVGRK